MNLQGKAIGFALTGSFCTIAEALTQLRALAATGAEIVPILSFAVDTTDTRFGTAQSIKDAIWEATGKAVIASIAEAEPIGPKKLLDAIIVCPCTGNTVAKIAGGITDTPVTMAVKAHLRNKRPVVLAISTNDGLSANAQNIGRLLNTRGIYFVPFGQDDAQNKNTSLVADNAQAVETLEKALEGEQLQPLLV